DAMRSAHRDDMPDLLPRELRGIEAVAVAAVDLHIAERRRHPLGFPIGPRGARHGDRADHALLTSNVEQLSGAVVAGAEQHDLEDLYCISNFQIRIIAAPLQVQANNSPTVRMTISHTFDFPCGVDFDLASAGVVDGTAAAGALAGVANTGDAIGADVCGSGTSSTSIAMAG